MDNLIPLAFFKPIDVNTGMNEVSDLAQSKCYWKFSKDLAVFPLF